MATFYKNLANFCIYSMRFIDPPPSCPTPQTFLLPKNLHVSRRNLDFLHLTSIFRWVNCLKLFVKLPCRYSGEFYCPFFLMFRKIFICRYFGFPNGDWSRHLKNPNFARTSISFFTTIFSQLFLRFFAWKTTFIKSFDIEKNGN